MAIKQLFLCHPRGAATEVHALAEALRLRGIVPWVDQQGGFSLGDPQGDKARRVIRSDCFGLILYATRDAFASDFIGKIEMDEALHALDDDPAYVLVVLPRRIDFKDLARSGMATYGVDLSGFASRALAGAGMNAEGAALEAHFGEVASDLLHTVLRRTADGAATLQLQYSTRERLADEPGDAMCVDATKLFAQGGNAVVDGERWARLHAGLRDVKGAVSACLGRPRIRMHGSKHLTGAFLFGFAFPSTAFDLDIRTKHDYWSTDHPPVDITLEADLRGGSATSDHLSVELSTLDQSVHGAVRRYQRRTGQAPFASLRLSVDPGVYGGVMTNAVACALAQQVRRKIAEAVARYPIAEIHLFAAVPQGLAVMIGHRLNALPPVQLHEYDGREYRPSYRAG